VDKVDDGGPPVDNGDVVTRTGDLAPRRSPRLATGQQHRRHQCRHHQQGEFTHDATPSVSQRSKGPARPRAIISFARLAAPYRTCEPQIQSASRSCGVNASRSQSPSRLIDNTITTSATPGNIVIHHSPENKNSL